MCLIIHKPRGIEVPLTLLRSATEYNPDGFGVMTYSGRYQLTIKRSHTPNFDELRRICQSVTEDECAIHLRLRTRGKITRTNTHPFQVTKDIYMAHNGTLNIHCRIPGQSDSWHIVNDYLRPILQKSPEVLHSRAFQAHLKNRIGMDNRLIFMDARQGKTVIINRELGIEYKGLWLSNTRWFDAEHFGLSCENSKINPVKDWRNNRITSVNPSNLLTVLKRAG